MEQDKENKWSHLMSLTFVDREITQNVQGDSHYLHILSGSLSFSVYHCVEPRNVPNSPVLALY